MADPRIEGVARTVNEILLDDGIRHAISIERLKNRVVREIIGFLNDDVYPDVLARLQSRLERIASRGSDSGLWTTQRYKDMVAAIRDSIDEGTRAARDLYLEQLYGTAKVEAAWQHAQIAEATVKFGLEVTKPSASLLRAIVTTEPFEGNVASAWFEKLGSETQRRLVNATNQGLIQGETVDQIVARVRGTKALGYSDGILETSRREAESIVRTGMNHITTRAREQVYSENTDVVDGVMWVSTLDDRTCPLCAALDGKAFSVGKGPRPPRHPLCRCGTVPNLKTWKQLGINLKEAPEGTRAAMGGDVPDAITFPDWLKNQPVQTQEDVLGVRRSALFRSGELKIDQFTNDRGRLLSLKELEKIR